MKTDTQLYSDIMEKLEFEPNINPANITLAVHDGIVTLAGQVRSYVEKRAVERAVRGMYGVKGIANELEVNLTTQFKRSDAEITKAAINALEWDINVPEDKIKVTVAEGSVKLTGDVHWWHQRQRAEKAVRYLSGVKSVDNQIKIKPSIPMIPTTEVKEKIRKEFERNALIDAEGIEVQTLNTKVTLKGRVRSLAERKEATRAAWSIPGVTEVDDQLTVNPYITS